MNLSVNGRIRRAVGVAFAAGVAGTSALMPAHAQESSSATTLQGVEVTGSRIRRVDTETSNLVQVLDRKQIEATGAATLGELVQAIPSITGAPLNASANNNGGSITGGGGSYGGSTAIDIRGLGPKRTLVLIDGQRVNNADPDAIPANMIERIEVLKAGAGSIYGTDAIGGVVNFITRKNFSGMEATAQYGETQRGDGSATGASITWGSNSAKGNALFGVNYNRQNDIKATDRNVTALPAGYSDPYAFSSSRAPTGKFNIGTGAGYTNGGTPCSSVTLIAGTDGTSKSDYRCFINSHNPSATDRFNYQPYNLDLDPTLHESLFGSGSYRITDDIKWFGQGYYTHSFSQRQLAPEPFDNATIGGIYPLANPAISISANNIYNPFGVTITSFAKRATDAGGRVLDYNVDQYQFTTGFKGTILDRFDWDLSVNYGKLDLSNVNRGYLNFSKVFQQLGPSFYAADGTPTCGTAAAPIPNCTPINVFGTTGSTLAALAATVTDVTIQNETDVNFDVNGDLFKLPAGMVAGALGFQYRNTSLSFTPDVLQSEFELSEANQQATQGGYDTREVFTEIQIPVLSGLPGVKSLSLDVGGRYSDFSTFGSHTAGKYAMEYRPYDDLLVRATYADTFRAPNVSELFGGATQSAPAYTDPCLDPTTGAATAASIAGHTIACKGVQIGATQPNSQGNGVNVGNAKLKPEHGYSTDFGLVFNPSFYKPLSVSVDLWHYSLKDGITSVSLPEILGDCYNDNSSTFCGNAPNGQPYFTRTNSGSTGSFTTTISNTTQPLLNSFSFYVTGWDYSVKLSYPKTHIAGMSLGNFELGADVTYVDQYRVTVFDPGTGNVVSVSSDAGTFDPATVISMPRVKGLGYLFWSQGPFSGSIEDRYVSNLEVGDASGYGATGCYHSNVEGYSCYRSGYANYVDIAGSYSLKKINTTFTVGINDLFDDGIQATYSSTYAGAPNPVYDVRGRNFYGKVSVRFK